jgi:hypothetical protein
LKLIVTNIDGIKITQGAAEEVIPGF